MSLLFSEFIIINKYLKVIAVTLLLLLASQKWKIILITFNLLYLHFLSVMVTVATDNRGLICGFPGPGTGVRVNKNVSSPSSLTSSVMVMSMMFCLLPLADPAVNVTSLFRIT